MINRCKKYELTHYSDNYGIGRVLSFKIEGSAGVVASMTPLNALNN